MGKIKHETITDVIKSMEGTDVIRGEAKDLLYRLANATNRELDVLYDEIEDLKGQLGL